MKNSLVVSLFVLTLFTSISVLADDTYDIIHLKNGKVLKGTIVEIIPDKSIEIKTFENEYIVVKNENIEKISKEEVNDINLREKSYGELGIVLGTPAGLNLAAGYKSNSIGFRLTGMTLGKLYGLQLNLAYMLSDYPNFAHSIGLAGGFLALKDEEQTLQYNLSSEWEKWQYIALVYNLNWGGFFLEAGLSIGKGDYPNPQLLLQIGYIHRSIEF